MITTLTSFTLSEPISRTEAIAIFRSTAPTYRGVPGLIRKTYLLYPDGATVGGIYLWKTRAAAEAMYTDDWRAFVRGKYGCEPLVTYLDSPVVVDNVEQQILVDEMEHAA